MAKRQPIVHRRTGTKAETSAMELSILIKKDTGVDFPPAKLIEFIRLNFVLGSVLAHEIHDDLAEQAAKGTSP